FRQTAFQHREEMKKGLEAKCGPSFSISGNATNTFVTFQGNFAETNPPQMTCTRVAGAGNCSVITEVEGKAPVTNALPVGSTSGLAVSGAGALYVLRDPNNGPTVVEQFNEPGEAAAPTAADATLGATAGFSFVQGFGVDLNSGNIYVAATTSTVGLSNAG